MTSQIPVSRLPITTGVQMSIGRQVRLKQLFRNPSGNLFGVAIDHFVTYGPAVEGGLAHLPTALGKLIEGNPDTVTMTGGTAKHLWLEHVNKARLIVEAASFTPDDRVSELLFEPLDAVQLGADALAVAIPVRGPSEGKYLHWLTNSVRASHKYEMPIVAHIYPRDYSDGVKIVFTPEEIAWAVRCGIETGVDVIKVGYVGDPVAFKEIVDNCPVPIVIAGGPKEPTLLDALTSTQAALHAGAKGAVVGRNVWGADDPKKAAKAYYGVINENLSPAEALAKAGL